MKNTWFQKTWLSIRKRIHELKGERYYKKIGHGSYLLDKDNLVDRHMDGFGGYELRQMDRFLSLTDKLRPKKITNSSRCPQGDDKTKKTGE